MTFDLGGGTMILPSQSCTDEACLERRRFDRWQSSTAEDIQANGQLVEAKSPKTLLRRRDRGTLGMHSLDVGSGKVTGTFVRDQVCIKGATEDASIDKQPRCFPLAMLVASNMADMPFDIEPYDGAIGLGLKGMSLSQDFNFLAGFHTGASLGQNVFFPNSFGLHIGSDTDGGEIMFGGYDIKRLTHPLKWTPVADPQEGRWQIEIAAIRVGNNTLEACRDRACKAAIDYSSSLLAAPSKLASGIESVLAKLAQPSGFGDGCQHLAIPDLHLVLKDDVTLTLPAEDWVSDFASTNDMSKSKPSCQPLLAHHHDADEELGQDLFVLGEATLRRYYTFFDADSLAVGFSLAAGSLDRNDKALPALPSGQRPSKKAKEALDSDNPVILLVQVKVLRSKTKSSLS